MDTPTVLPPVPQALLTALSEFIQRPEGLVSEIPMDASAERQTLADALEYVAGALVSGAYVLNCRRHQTIQDGCEVCFHASQLHAVGFALAEAANFAQPAFPDPTRTRTVPPERLSGLNGHERTTLASMRNGKIDCGNDPVKQPCAHEQRWPSSGPCLRHQAAARGVVQRLAAPFVPDC